MTFDDDLIFSASLDEGDPTNDDLDADKARVCRGCEEIRWNECFPRGSLDCEDCRDPGPEDCYTQRELS